MKKPSAKKGPKNKGNRGGPRPGAGRKPKPQNPDEQAKSKMRPHRRVTAGASAMALTEQTDLARKFAKLAIETLADVAMNAQSENARAAAAERLLQWGYGKPLGIGNETLRPGEKAGPKEKPLGKKEELAKAAKNPDTNTSMGDLMAKRAEQAKLDS